jgi:hypothetical protein
MELDHSAEPDNLLAAEESSLRQLGQFQGLIRSLASVWMYAQGAP